MANYRICKIIRFDNFGRIRQSPLSPVYFVQRKKSFLWMEYWSNVRYGSIRTTMTFHTSEEAVEFCFNLMKGIKPNSTKVEIISEY